MAVCGNDLTAIVTAFILICVAASGVIRVTDAASSSAKTDSTLKCYECNVWKAGYGYPCYQPRNKTGCITCMKIETTIFMGFYKNTPRTATIISRTCAESKAVPHINGCYEYQMADGHNRRCYCNTDFCNSAPRRTVTVLSSLLSVVFAAAFRLLAN